MIGILWLICWGVLDWRTGPELSLSAFYLPGIALVAWFSGRKMAAGVALFGALTWLAAQWAAAVPYSNPWIPYWNALIRFVFFLITALLIGEVRERQRTERVLRKQDGILRSVLNSMEDGVVVVGGEGRLLSFNPAAERILGAAPPDLDAHQWSAGIEAKGADRLSQAIRGDFAGTTEWRLLPTSAAERRVLRMTALPLLDDHQVPGGVVLVFTDLTARRSLERQIAEASELEQRRIGQDLHDGVCQHLAGVAFAAATLQNQLVAGASHAEAAAAGEIASLINEAIGMARGLSHGLYPASLADGIEVGLRALATTTHERSGIRCIVRMRGEPPELDPIHAVHLYRIAQEAIANACRHAAARVIEIELRGEKEELLLSVKDDGSGMDGSSPAAGGIGLHLMRYRAELSGAALEVDSAPGAGTTVRCRLPLTEPQLRPA
jgi:PAS domain S-box-containing protein